MDQELFEGLLLWVIFGCSVNNHNDYIQQKQQVSGEIEVKFSRWHLQRFDRLHKIKSENISQLVSAAVQEVTFYFFAIFLGYVFKWFSRVSLFSGQELLECEFTRNRTRSILGLFAYVTNKKCTEMLSTSDLLGRPHPENCLMFYVSIVPH